MPRKGDTDSKRKFADDRYYLPGVYLITNTATGFHYIGSTTRSITERWNNHCKKLRWGTHPNKQMQTDYYEYGIESFTIGVLASFDSRMSAETLCMEELHWFRRFRDSGVATYNIRVIAQIRMEVLVGNTRKSYPTGHGKRN